MKDFWRTCNLGLDIEFLKCFPHNLVFYYEHILSKNEGIVFYFNTEYLWGKHLDKTIDTFLFPKGITFLLVLIQNVYFRFSIVGENSQF